MTISLQLLFEEINQVSEHDLRSQLVPKVMNILQPSDQGSFLRSQLLGDRNLQKVLKVALSVEHNPVHVTWRHPCP